MAASYAAAGYLWGTDMGAPTAVALAAGVFATYVLFFNT
jgi:hypothetical protein